MKGKISTIFTLVFAVVGFIVCCSTDCPPEQNVERGTFQITSSSGGAPENGTIVISDNSVEVGYPDDDGNMWRVVYRVVSEE